MFFIWAHKVRKQFFYVYLICIVILNNVWICVSRILWRDNYAYHICNGDPICLENFGKFNSMGAIVGQVLPNVLLSCYFCFVIK